MLEPLDRVEVVDRYPVKFVLKEPFVWLVNTLAYPWTMWIVAPGSPQADHLRHLRHSVVRGRATVFRLHERLCDHRILGAPCEALCAQP